MKTFPHPQLLLSLLLGLSFIRVTTTTVMAQSYPWFRYGGNHISSAVAADGSGNTYVLATFKGTTTYGSYTFNSFGSPHKTDLAFVKYDKDGNVKWARQIGSTSDDYLGDVAISKYGSNLFITGSFKNTVSFGSYHGYMTGALSSAGSTDAFVARYNAGTGTLQWSRKAGGTSTDRGNGIFTDIWGDDVYIAGSFQGTANFSGTNISSYGGTSDAFYAKYDENGNFSLVKKYGGSGYDFATSIAVGKYYDNVYITGGNSPSSNPYVANFFLAKYNSLGTYQWGKTYGSSAYIDAGEDIVLNSSEHYVYVVGTFYTPNFNMGGQTLTNQGGADAFVARYSENGNLLWAEGIGGTSTDNGQSIAEDGSKLYISGTFKNTVDFGHQSFTSYGSTDMFVSQLDSDDGEFRWTSRLGSSHTDYGKGNITVSKYNLLYFSGHRGKTGFVYYPVGFSGKEAANARTESSGSPQTSESQTNAPQAGESQTDFTFIPLYSPASSYVWKLVPPTIPSIAEFRLINADTDVDLEKIYGFEQINYSEVGTDNINIKANTNPSTVGSVVFQLGTDPERTENKAPYAFAGDNNGDYAAWSPPSGSYKLTATPYSGSNGTGVKGYTKILFFSINDDLSSARTEEIAKTTKQNSSGLTDENGLAPGTLSLAAYPNPFTEQTTLSFTAPQDGTVHLAIYDITGAIVKEVFQGAVQAGQPYQFAADASELTGAFYISRLTMGNKSSHQKLLLNR